MINKMILQGRLTRDPELSTISTGTSVCKFCVAWSEKYKDKETQLFLNCTAWSGTAEFVSKYFKKGQECVIEGKLETQKYEKDGETKTVTNCTVEKVNFCGSKSDSGDNAKPNKQVDELVPVTDDDLPF